MHCIMVKKVILWTAPRCLSTAFLCSISTLKNTKHFHELFSGPHYFGPERRNVRFPPEADVDFGDFSAEELTYESSKRALLKNYPNIELIFAKEMAYCLPESMWDELLSGKFQDFTHTFLIRDPARAIYSNYKAILKDKVGDAALDPSEVGFTELYKLYNLVKKKKGMNPIVVDAFDLQTQPFETMKSYCEAVNIQFGPNMIKWEKGTSEKWCKLWSKAWFSAVDESTGFIKMNPAEQKPVPLNELPPDVIKFIEESRAYFDEMKTACLQPTL